MLEFGQLVCLPLQLLLSLLCCLERLLQLIFFKLHLLSDLYLDLLVYFLLVMVLDEALDFFFELFKRLDLLHVSHLQLSGFHCFVIEQISVLLSDLGF